MADKFIYPDLTENTAPLGSDIDVMEDDPNGTPLTQYIYKGSNNLLPDGFLINGKISVTVASNNITVAIKTKSGGNPSLTDPVSVWINGTYRRITAALSVTKNAATNWFASGAADLAALEVDYFVYLIWNTTPATDIMDIGFARIAYGRVYSDFSGTTTNEKYLAFGNASTPTSTDNCIVIGRFAATLSAAAGHTWTVPTYTNANLIQVPIYTTRLLTHAPVLAGWSANPTGVYRYRFISDHICRATFFQNLDGTSNATTATVSIPITALNLASFSQYGAIPYVVDNGANVAAGIVSASPNSVTLTLQKSAVVAWTASAAKAVRFIMDIEF